MGRLCSSTCSLRASDACMTVRVSCSLQEHDGSCARRLQSPRAEPGSTSHLPPWELIDECSLAERPPWALRSQAPWELLEADLQAVAPGLAQAGCRLPQQASCKCHQRGLSMAMVPIRQHDLLASCARCQSRIRPFTALPCAERCQQPQQLLKPTGAHLCRPQTSLVPLLCLPAQ